MRKIDKKELHSIFIGIRKNNELEFNRLYDKYKSLIYGVAFSILKNKEDSEEIVQIVLLKIFKLEKEKLPKENEATWLYRVTKNETLNFLRDKKETVSIDEIYYMKHEDKEINKIIEKDTYNRILSKLNEREQEIVSLKIFSNLSFNEISTILNVPIGTVQWRYYKSLHTLKTLLSNFAMYILTIGIFIIHKLGSKNQKEIKIEILPNIENKVDEESTKKEQVTEENKEDLREDKKDITGIEKNESTQENTNVSITEESTSINLLDIGLISISSIFLIFTITFSVIFIKHQQNAKKKCLNNRKGGTYEKK